MGRLRDELICAAIAMFALAVLPAVATGTPSELPEPDQEWPGWPGNDPLRNPRLGSGREELARWAQKNLSAADRAFLRELRISTEGAEG